MKKFTLMELLVVVAVIAILASMLLPALGKARTAAQVSTSLNNMKQLAVGTFMYLDDNEDQFMLRRRLSSDYAWDDYLSSYIGLGMTEDELEASGPSDRSAFNVLRCPLDNIERSGDRPIRTYAVNSISHNTKLIFNDGATRNSGIVNDLSIKHSDLPDPTNTIMMAEFAKNNNTVGHGSKSDVSGPQSDLYWATYLTTDVADPNHHNNGLKNPILLCDGSARVIYMPSTLAHSNEMWLSKVPKN